MERFADGHMTSSLASPWAHPDKHGPWNFREQVPAPSSLLEPAETQGGIISHEPAPNRSRSDRYMYVCVHVCLHYVMGVSDPGRQDRGFGLFHGGDTAVGNLTGLS